MWKYKNNISDLFYLRSSFIMAIVADDFISLKLVYTFRFHTMFSVRVKYSRSQKFYVLEFGPWSGWRSCSVTCGSGERRRTRQCIRPGTCSGSNSETESCYEGQCPGVTMVYYFIFCHIWSFS